MTSARAVAVLVVATPCPLILAAPVAIVVGPVAGRSPRRRREGRRARSSSSADGEILLFDKTGTITGRPTRRVAEIVTADGHERRRGAPPRRVARPGVARTSSPPPSCAPPAPVGSRSTLPDDVEEVPGSRRPRHGRRARRRGRQGELGRRAPATSLGARRLGSGAELDGALTVFVGVDGVPVGRVAARRPDPTRRRPHDPQLRRDGIRRIVMVTGDRDDVAQTVGAVDRRRRGARRTHARPRRSTPSGSSAERAHDHGRRRHQRRPGARARRRRRRHRRPRRDRVVGGGRRRADRRSARPARRSASSSPAAPAASRSRASSSAWRCRSSRWSSPPFGYLPPAWGALLQEVIDVAVILNALRALRDTTSASRGSAATDAALARRFSAEHRDAAPRPRPLRARRRRARRDADRRVARPGPRASTGSSSRSSTRTSRPRTASSTRSLADVARRQRPDRHDEPRPRRDRAPHPPHRPRPRRHRPGRHPTTTTSSSSAASSTASTPSSQLHFAQEDEGYLSLADTGPAGREQPGAAV